ncbi:MAG: lysine--tRNA ligase [Candidatus Spechtbacteria bacterium]|nr:lysine--tRNA ligase [Candidatus Spechtbacteria bacterium]
MALEDYQQSQLQKRHKMLSGGNLPYPIYTKRTHTVLEAQEGFKKLVDGEKEVVLTGRVLTMRRHGGATFGDIQDGTGTFQFFAGRDQLGAGKYDEIGDFVDVGDFIEIRGILFITKSGQQTLQVASLKVISKATRPLPEKWHGLQDVEERYRKRYLDLLMNGETRKVFEARSTIVKATREFLDGAGFMEVETSILQPIPGGASAKPFKTHLNALDMDLYLRVAPELDLKKLLVGGFEKVYEIGRLFRNEGMDFSHNPEFTALEFYWAYADYKELMKFSEKMFTHIFKKLGTYPKFEHEGKSINLETPWPRIEFTALLNRYLDIDYETLSRDALKKKAELLGIAVEEFATKGQIGDLLYKKACKPEIKNPTFIIHQPIELTPLAKALEDNPAYAARFQLVIDGWELVNAFSELNDPVLQRKAFEDQEDLHKRGDAEAQRMDESYVEAMEYGMPPAAGFAFGLDRLTAFITNTHSLREVILFPTMRQKKQNTE